MVLHCVDMVQFGATLCQHGATLCGHGAVWCYTVSTWCDTALTVVDVDKRVWFSCIQSCRSMEPMMFGLSTSILRAVHIATSLLLL